MNPIQIPSFAPGLLAVETTPQDAIQGAASTLAATPTLRFKKRRIENAGSLRDDFKTSLRLHAGYGMFGLYGVRASGFRIADRQGQLKTRSSKEQILPQAFDLFAVRTVHSDVDNLTQRGDTLGIAAVEVDRAKYVKGLALLYLRLCRLKSHP